VDTSNVPNGRYVLRVIALDAPRAHPPAFAPLRVSKGRLSFELDNRSPDSIAASLEPRGGPGRRGADRREPAPQGRDLDRRGRWDEVHPVERIADSLEETYEIALPASPGAPDRHPPGHGLSRQRATAASTPVGAALQVLLRSAPADASGTSSSAPDDRRAARGWLPRRAARPALPRFRARRPGPGEPTRVLPSDGAEAAALLGGAASPGPVAAACAPRTAVVVFTRSEPLLAALRARRVA